MTHEDGGEAFHHLVRAYVPHLEWGWIYPDGTAGGGYEWDGQEIQQFQIKFILSENYGKEEVMFDTALPYSFGNYTWEEVIEQWVDETGRTVHSYGAGMMSMFPDQLRIVRDLYELHSSDYEADVDELSRGLSAWL